jgi:hypothetical protein
MKIVTELDQDVMKRPKLAAGVVRLYLRALVISNAYYLKKHPNTPLLYQSGVKYAPEPNAGKYEEFASIATCLQRGWGDCDDLAAWRAAEIRVREGRPANILVYWRKREGAGTIWHVQVRRPDTGECEDPSRLLGM